MRGFLKETKFHNVHWQTLEGEGRGVGEGQGDRRGARTGEGHRQLLPNAVFSHRLTPALHGIPHPGQRGGDRWAGREVYSLGRAVLGIRVVGRRQYQNMQSSNSSSCSSSCFSSYPSCSSLVSSPCCVVLRRWPGRHQLPWDPPSFRWSTVSWSSGKTGAATTVVSV